MKRGKPKSIIRRIGTGWFGLMLYPILTILLSELINIILKLFGISLPLLYIGFTVIAVCAVIFVCGILNAFIPRLTEYRIKLNSDKPLRIVLISDLHLGFYCGYSQVCRIVKKCNLLNADAVMIAGDIFDEEYSALRSPDKTASVLARLQSRLGTFACEGNHDNYCHSTFQEKFTDAANIVMLKDSLSITTDFTVYGRRDLWRGRISANALIDNKKTPVIVLDHNPAEFTDSIDAGADLVLCGHTHNGQTFPGNLLLKLRSQHSYGLKAYENGFCIVTSGSGIWGFPMKIGVKSEIAVIDIE